MSQKKSISRAKRPQKLDIPPISVSSPKRLCIDSDETKLGGNNGRKRLFASLVESSDDEEIPPEKPKVLVPDTPTSSLPPVLGVHDQTLWDVVVDSQEDTQEFPLFADPTSTQDNSETNPSKHKDDMAMMSQTDESASEHQQDPTTDNRLNIGKDNELTLL